MPIDHDAVGRQFQIEAAEHFDALDELLVLLETQGCTPALLQRLLRIAHTLKGTAAMVGLTEVSTRAHALEDLLERTGTGKVDLLLAAVDALRKSAGVRAAAGPPGITAREALAEWMAARDQDSTDLPQPSEPSKSLRVRAAKLDQVLNLVGELVQTRGRITEVLNSGRPTARLEAQALHQDAERWYLELQEQVMRLRMVPVGPTFHRQMRVVRDLALRSGLDARLVIEGDDVEVDVDVLERLQAPLGHAIEMALAEGIESPSARTARGKPGTGNVRLRATYRNSRVVIEVSDDGEGAPDPVQLARLGRLVGAMSATLEVRAEPGLGTALALSLPLSLAVIQGFQVQVAGDVYILPLDAVVECAAFDIGGADVARATGVVQHRGHPLPYLRLGTVLGTGDRRASTARETLLLLKEGEQALGVVVDGILGEGQTLVKPFTKALGAGSSRALVIGTSLLSSGKVALVLDVGHLVSVAGEARADGARC